MGVLGGDKKMNCQRNEGLVICLIGAEGRGNPVGNSSSLWLKWQNSSLSYHQWSLEGSAPCRQGSGASGVDALGAPGTSLPF